MSFILDALKRAERERSLGRAPDAQDVARQLPPPVDQPAKLNPWLIGVIAVLAAVVLLLGSLELFRPRAAAITLRTQPVETIPTTKPAVVARTPTGGKPAIADSRGIRSMDDLTGAEPSTDGEMPASEDVDASASGLSMPLRSIRPQVNVESVPIDDSGSSALSGTAAGTLNDSQSRFNSRQPTVVNIDRGADQPVAPPPPSETANLEPMPESYQEGFPQLSVQVHVYNAEPSRRFVMIDGKTYHQGDTIAAGPHIVEIHNDGIVFDWKGHRTLYPLSN